MIIRGKSVSEGVAVGRAYLYRAAALELDSTCASDNAGAKEYARFTEAREAADGQLAALEKSMAGTDEAKIFTAHRDILFDSSIEGDVEEMTQDGHNAPYAVEAVCEQYATALENLNDPMFSARASDIRDVKRRLLHILLGVELQDLSHLPENTILVAEDLQPSDTAGLDKTHVLAIVTEKGGETSHSAIIARKNGLPALSGVMGVMQAVQQGQLLAADAVDGMLIVDPDENTVKDYEEKARKLNARRVDTARYLAVKPALADGTPVKICLNIASDADSELAPAVYADGVGLLRSEFFYMGRSELPSEEEQLAAYKKILMAFGEKEVILRTLDIGGDKKTDCLPLPEEDNPFLGLRAVRFCFTQEAVFRTQLRAAMRAAEFGNLSVMFPMISSLDEIRRAKALAEDVRSGLIADGITPAHISWGIMIEIPSVALIADAVAAEVDFASIGTNDLCQYLLAVDRLNPTVGDYYQKYHPAMFRIISIAAEAFRKAGKSLSVCGELGGDVLAAPVLVGLGISKLSMNVSSVAGVKRVLSELTMEKCERLAAEVLKLATAGQVEEYLRLELNR